MTASYRALSSSLAKRLREAPALVRAVIDADAGDPQQPGVPPELRAMFNGLPPELRERLGESSELQGQFADVVAMHAESSRSAEEALVSAGFTVADVRDALDIEKAWHGLHYLLAGTVWQPTDPPGNAVLGGVEVGDDLGYGAARLMDAAEVARTAAALGDLQVGELRARYDADAMTKAKLYGGHWDDLSERDWVTDAFDHVTAYFGEAAKRGDAMLLYIV